VLVAVAALAPGVLVPPSVVVMIVKAFARLDNAPGHEQHEPEQNGNRSSDRLPDWHVSSGLLGYRVTRE
jgi:hypothetical protein